MHDLDLPFFLWDKASRTTVSIQNQIRHRVLEGMTPEESFSKRKPEVRHMRIFGCIVYIHVPKDKSDKLEPSGNKGIFVAYSESSKSYKIHIP